MHLLCNVRAHCIQFFDVYYSCLHGNITLKKAASNSCILNIEYMATLWVHVQCRTWQDRLHIVGLTLVSYRASNILCDGSPLYLGPARSHFLLYIPMQNIVANTTISR